MLEPVVWLAVPGYPNYEVSSVGEVRNAKTGRLKKQRPDSAGRPTVTLSKGNYVCPKMVHRLVAEAFLGPMPEGLETCHNDGRSSNNRASNLRYDTKLNNEADKLLHGTRNSGERHGKAKLSEALILAIRKGLGSDRAVAAAYGVSRWTIRAARTGRTWGHL